MAHPTYGFRTFKGEGSRLLRDVEDDWVNVQAKEGYSGWKEGILFLRSYAWQPARQGGAGHHLYRVEAIRLAGLDTVGVAHGRTAKDAWKHLYADLKRKGHMPPTATE